MEQMVIAGCEQMVFNDCIIDDTAGVKAEFRCNVGHYFHDAKTKKVMIMHNCSL